MFTLDGIRKFHAWTHLSITLLFDHLDTVPAAAYTKELAGFGRPTLHTQIIHLIQCEAFWVHTLQRLPFERFDPARFPAVSDARYLQRDVGAQTLAWLSRLTDQALNTNTELHFSDGDTDIRTPALILHHIFTHAFHHKGQIVAMCRLLGYPAPDTDLNQFE